MTAPLDDPIYVTNLTKAEAEDLLDWLEANGYRQRELFCTGERFAVRYWR